MRSDCVVALMGLVLVVSAGPAIAALKVTAPLQVCGSLKEAGLPTGGWRQEYGLFSCASRYKELGANNLAFYAEGQLSKVTEVKLVLNVNQAASAASAHAELLGTAKTLCLKVTGEPLPQAAAAAIQKGRSATAKIGGSSIRIIREDWPTGRGYEIRMYIE